MSKKQKLTKETSKEAEPSPPPEGKTVCKVAWRKIEPEPTPQSPSTPSGKAEQSLTTLEESVKIAEEFLNAVSSLGHRCSWEKNAIRPLLFYPDEDVKKVQECTGKFLQMYDEWATKLCLTYQPWDFHLHQMWEDRKGLLTRIEKVIESLKTLRDEAEKKATETPEVGGEDNRYFIKDILGSTGIKKTLFYDLRKKKVIPLHYAKWGNSPYWRKDGYQKACENIKKYLSQEKN